MCVHSLRPSLPLTRLKLLHYPPCRPYSGSAPAQAMQMPARPQTLMTSPMWCSCSLCALSFLTAHVGHASCLVHRQALAPLHEHVFSEGAYQIISIWCDMEHQSCCLLVTDSPLFITSSSHVHRCWALAQSWVWRCVRPVAGLGRDIQTTCGAE